MDYPDMVRNVAIVGHLQHGKTLLTDMLLRHTHPEFNDINGAEVHFHIFVYCIVCMLICCC